MSEKFTDLLDAEQIPENKMKLAYREGKCHLPGSLDFPSTQIEVLYSKLKQGFTDPENPDVVVVYEPTSGNYGVAGDDHEFQEMSEPEMVDHLKDMAPNKPKGTFTSKKLYNIKDFKS